MNQRYAEYLSSEDWEFKRDILIISAGNRCSVCGSYQCLEAHHLTYERIFNERLTDLLPLCRKCHKTAEEMKEKGFIPRSGDVAMLARETIRLLSETASRNAPKKSKRTSAAYRAIDYANNSKPIPGMSRALSRIANGCVFLQRMAGDKPFFLSARGASKILGLKNPFHGLAYLNELERIGWIKRVTKGQLEGRKASEWMLTGKI